MGERHQEGAVYNLFIVKEKAKKLAQMMGTVIQSIPSLNTVQFATYYGFCLFIEAWRNRL